MVCYGVPSMPWRDGECGMSGNSRPFQAPLQAGLIDGTANLANYGSQHLTTTGSSGQQSMPGSDWVSGHTTVDATACAELSGWSDRDNCCGLKVGHTGMDTRTAGSSAVRAVNNAHGTWNTVRALPVAGLNGMIGWVGTCGMMTLPHKMVECSALSWECQIETRVGTM
jgi:hypothetical protein